MRGSKTLARNLKTALASDELNALSPEFSRQVYDAIGKAASTRNIVNSPGLHYSEREGILGLFTKRFSAEERDAFVRSFSAIDSMTTTFATDFLGYSSTYLQLINDQFDDYAVFKRNLSLLGRFSGAFAGMPNMPCPIVELCLLASGSEGFEKVANRSVALELQRLLILVAEKENVAAPAYLLKQQTRLAELEFRVGQLERARHALKGAQVLQARTVASPSLKRRLTRLKRSLQRRDAPTQDVSSLRNRQEVAATISAFASEQYWEQQAEWSYDGIAALIRDGRKGRLNAPSWRRLRATLNRRAGEHRRVRACQKGRNRSETAQELALLLPYFSYSGAESACRYIFDRNLTRKRQTGSKLIRANFRNYADFGTLVPFFNSVGSLSQAMQRLGYRLAAQTTRSIAVELLRETYPDPAARAEFVESLSADFAMVLVHDARALIKQRQLEPAITNLTEAQGVSVARFESAWRDGSGSLDELARQVRTPLHQAQIVWRDLLRSPLGKRETVLEGAFVAAQLVGLNDTATSIAAGLRRSSLLDEKTATLIEARETAVWTAQHINNLKQSASFEFTYGLTAAAARADAIASGKINTSEEQLPIYTAFESVRPIKIQNVKEQLSENDALILIAPTSDGCETFLISKREARWRACTSKAGALARLVVRIRAGLDPSKIDLSSPRSFDLVASHRLYNAVFGDLLKNRPELTRLHVVAGGEVAALPLSVLVTQRPKPKSGYADAAWLVKKYAVSHLISAGDLRRSKRVASIEEATRFMIGFGDPAFNGPKAALNTTNRSLPSISMFRGRRTILGNIGPIPELPETRVELTTVAKSYGGSTPELLMRKEATESQVKKLSREGRLAEAKLLYFATHGVLSSELDGRNDAGLLLSKPGQPTDEDDGLLSTSEISQLKLNADMVVLSACNTAAARRTGGVVYSGLAKSFLEAGARTVLVSHWPVVSDAATEILIGMFRELGATTGTDKATALQTTLIAMSQNRADPATAHPAYWGPFVLVGATDG